MPQTTTDQPNQRGWLERVGIGVLVTVAALAIGAAALLALYLNRISDAAAAISRVDAMGTYAGRPSSSPVDGTSAVNYLLSATGSAGDLDAVVIAHLSASRRDLTLIAVPADLTPDAGAATLAERYATDPLLVVRDLENLTRARMDHQVHLDVARFAAVVDAIGGVEVDGRHLDGTQAVAALTSSPAAQRSQQTAELLRTTLIAAASRSAIIDPTRFARILSALTPCLKVDAGLTADQIESTLVESRVHPREIATVRLQVSPDGPAPQAEPASLQALRDGLARDDLTAAAASGLLPSTEPHR